MAGRRGDGGATRRRGRPRAGIGAACALVVAVAATACATAGADGPPAAEGAEYGPNSLASLGIPLNAVPGPGECRIWRPRSAASRQMGVGPCRRLVPRVGEGGWLLRHPVPPEGGPDRVHLVVYGEQGPSLVRVFDRETGERVAERPARAGRGAGAGPRPPPERRAADTARAPAAGEGRPGGGTLYGLGIPRGAVPPGRCRVWDPELPPDEQEPPAPCEELRDRVGGDDWLLQHRRSGEVGGESDRLVVAAYEDGRVISVRVFDASTGTLLEERTPEGG